MVKMKNNRMNEKMEVKNEVNQSREGMLLSSAGCFD
jgi:hypothetical protein